MLKLAFETIHHIVEHLRLVDLTSLYNVNKKFTTIIKPQCVLMRYKIVNLRADGAMKVCVDPFSKYTMKIHFTAFKFSSDKIGFYKETEQYHEFNNYGSTRYTAVSYVEIRSVWDVYGNYGRCKGMVVHMPQFGKYCFYIKDPDAPESCCEYFITVDDKMDSNTMFAWFVYCFGEYLTNFNPKEPLAGTNTLFKTCITTHPVSKRSSLLCYKHLKKGDTEYVLSAMAYWLSELTRKISKNHPKLEPFVADDAVEDW
jgi:hypothetical protein